MSALVLPAEDLQPIDWGKIDCAIFDWLDVLLKMDRRIIDEKLGEAQPSYPYLSLLRSSEIDVGGVDENRQRTLDVDGKILGEDITAGPAFENESITYQPVNFTLSIQAHVDLDNGARDPNTDAFAMLSKAKRSIGQQSVVDQLSVGGLSVVDTLEVVNLNEVVNGKWISRAGLDVVFSTASVMSEKVGFFDKVEIESIPLGITPPILIDAS